MSTNALQMPSHTAAPAVGTALRELGTAAFALGAALYATVFQSTPRTPLSVRDQANEVRRMAEDYCQTDPNFAQDLFAAADRHEELHG